MGKSFSKEDSTEEEQEAQQKRLPTEMEKATELTKNELEHSDSDKESPQETKTIPKVPSMDLFKEKRRHSGQSSSTSTSGGDDQDGMVVPIKKVRRSSDGENGQQNAVVSKLEDQDNQEQGRSTMTEADSTDGFEVHERIGKGEMEKPRTDVEILGYSSSSNSSIFQSVVIPLVKGQRSRESLNNNVHTPKRTVLYPSHDPRNEDPNAILRCPTCGEKSLFLFEDLLYIHLAKVHQINFD